MSVKMTLQETVLHTCQKDKIEVEAFLMNGVKMPGFIVDFDDEVVVFWSEGKQRLVYKHAISTIIPTKQVLPSK